MGKYNPENGAFCIVDFEKEKAAQSKRSKSDDKRLTVSGKVCAAGGWKIPELVRIASQRLKMPPPKSFRADDSREKMLERINREEKFNLTSIFTEEEIEQATDDDLRRMLYWGTTKSEKGSRGGKPICEAMRKWFEANGLLEIDHQCGKAGKAKTVTISDPASKVKEVVYRIETFVPSRQEEEFKAYSKEIIRLMGECFNEKKYKPEINDNMWVMIFSRKKLVGFMTIGDNNVISNVCIAKNYRRNKIPVNAMKQATQYIAKKRGQTPVIMVDNRSKDYKKLVHMYESFGFSIVQNDGRFTHMSHSYKP
jgi:predicted GNAT family N-acyltransferase